jgi:hypothetical protein
MDPDPCSGGGEKSAEQILEMEPPMVPQVIALVAGPSKA